eukprot:739018-Pelagomonas_calceolata.AAC.1
MAHPAVESHGELERFWGLPSKPCFAKLSRSVFIGWGVPLFALPVYPAHRLAHELVGLGAPVTSQRPPIDDAIAHG